MAHPLLQEIHSIQFIRLFLCGYVKDDIGDRAEVTSLVAALAATLEKLLTAICGWLISRQDVHTIAGHMADPSDISPVISDDRDSFENCIEIP